MNKPLYLFVGKSASGKTTAADRLECEYRYKPVQSYTTRAPRYDGEAGHTFITNEEFNNLKNIVSYTEYDGNRYCTTKEMLDDSNVFVVDVPGVEFLLQNYNTERTICIFYFDTSVSVRIKRMLNRGASDTEIVSRLMVDEESDWYSDLDGMVWNYAKIANKDVELFKINANCSERNVLEFLLYYINKIENQE